MPFNRGNTPKHERVRRVIWFKDNELIPMYVYYRKIGDSQKNSPPKFMHWSDPNVVQNRASFYADSSIDLACLQLKNVKITDEGIYTCRVDFSIDDFSIGYITESDIKLTVTVPPEKPVITDITPEKETLNDSLSTTLGPYRIGSDIDICCSVVGGYPSPKVTWWKDNKLKKNVFVNLNSEKVETCLSIKNVVQGDNGSLLTCKADNGGSESYSTVKLKLLLKSSDIEKQVKNTAMNISKDLGLQQSDIEHSDENFTYNYFMPITMKSSCPILQRNVPFCILMFILLRMV